MNRAQLALAQLRGQMGQMASAIIVIAMAVALTTSLLLANGALQDSFRSSLDALTGQASLQIRPLSGGTLSENLLTRIRSVPGVDDAAVLLRGTAFLVPNLLGEGASQSEEQIQIIGVDMLDDGAVRIYRDPAANANAVEDPLVFLNQPDSALAPSSFLGARGLRQGDRLTIQTPLGRHTLTLRGILSDEGVGHAFGGRFLIMDLFSAQAVLGQIDRVSQIDIVTTDPTVTDRLRSELAPHLGISRGQELRANLAETVVGFEALLAVIAFLGLILAVIISANRLSTLYQERFWEIGVLRGLGWTPLAVVGDLLLEITLVSLVAVSIGLPLGILLAQIIVAPLTQTLALNLQQNLALPQIAIQPLPLILGAVAGVSSGLLAAWLPARRAIQANIVVLKEKKRRRDPLPDSRLKRCCRLALPLSAAFALGIQTFTGSGVVGGGVMVLLVASGALLIQPGLRLLGEPIGRLFGSAAMVGVRDQSRAPSRAIGATGVLLAGVGLVVWIGNTGKSFEHYVAQEGNRVGTQQLVVDGTVDSGARGGTEPRLDEKLIQEIGAIPGVAAVAAEVMALTDQPRAGILAVDPLRFREDKFDSWPLRPGATSTALKDVAEGRAILIDRKLASMRGLVIGDRARIATPTGILELPVAGISATSFLSPAGDLVLSRQIYREHWRDRTVHRLYIALAIDADKNVIRDRILGSVGEEYRIRVSDADEYAGWLAASVREGFAFLDVMVALCLVVVVIGTADALAANVLERTGEIAILRSLGYPPSSIAAMIFSQSLAIGLVGAGLAVALGMLMSFAFVDGLLQMILGWQLEVLARYTAALSAAALGVLACILGGLLPALRASRFPIATALRAD